MRFHFAFISAIVAWRAASVPVIPAEKDWMDFSREDMMAALGIDPEADRRTGQRVAEGRDSGRNVDEMGHYFQGDILLDPSELNGVVNQNRTWPGGEVPYTFWLNEFDAAATADILRALAEYEELTGGCLRFRPRREEDGNNFLFFTSEFSSCFARIGHAPRIPNIVNYEFPHCTDSYGIIQHELLHGLGFYHEQSRTDRNDYVNIKWENIEKDGDNGFNFLKFNESVIDPYGEEYDYGSVMHYSRTAFSYDGIHQTVVPFNPPDAEIGQRVHVSDVDVRKLNNMYPCEGNRHLRGADYP